MDIKCEECGKPFSREVRHRYLYLTIITAAAFVILLLLVLLMVSSGTLLEGSNILASYGVGFTAIFTIAFYALYRGEVRRNTLCHECLKKTEEADKQRKITWR
jgi:hypothetical protein